jgi:signal transduction histidine kinase
VKDEGSGIDPAFLPHIFDLFAQADQSLDRSQGGLGIGLTLVKHLVELHGGRSSAHSDGLGQGRRGHHHAAGAAGRPGAPRLAPPPAGRSTTATVAATAALAHPGGRRPAWPRPRR